MSMLKRCHYKMNLGEVNLIKREYANSISGSLHGYRDWQRDPHMQVLNEESW